MPVDRRRRMDKSPACGESYWRTPGPTIPLTRQARSKSNVRAIRGENPLRKRQPRGCAGPKSGNFFTSPLISFRPSQLLLCGIGLRQSGRWGKPGGPPNACLKAKRGTEASRPCYHRCSRFACPASRCWLRFRRGNGIGQSLRSCSWRRQRKRHLPLGLILG
jgi:hypothetical protein